VCSSMVRWGTWSPPSSSAATRVLEADEVAALPAGVLDEDRSKALLQSIEVPVPWGRIAASAEEAGALAEQLDGPAVLKAIAENLTHKSEFGAVAVGVVPGDAPARFTAMVDEVTSSAPAASVSGVRVEEMVGGGLELFIGAVRADPFGVLIAVGAGGT